MDDLHLYDLPNTVAADRAITQTTQYLLNFPFANGLEVHRNTKFPGTQVVALERKDLLALHGCRPVHMPYKPTEILSWMHPQVLTIPPLAFPHRWFFPATETKNTYDVLLTEFGDFDDEIVPIHLIDFAF